jgi:hypothetical protein
MAPAGLWGTWRSPAGRAGAQLRDGQYVPANQQSPSIRIVASLVSEEYVVPQAFFPHDQPVFMS